ncbi:MAG: CotH kinase family protein [Chitinispirillia bacterium]|nr:CotH kinase family protein [Chitinispirillia bacterium]
MRLPLMLLAVVTLAWAGDTPEEGLGALMAGGLPVIRIDTEGGVEVLSKKDWITMTFALDDPANPENNISATGRHQIRSRGNSTRTYPKRPYRIRFRENVSLFGNAARRNWVLLAEYQDPTFLMTATAFKLGRDVLEQPYTPTYQHVHLYLNGEYQGVYGVTEHRQADPDGVGVNGRPGIDLNEGWFVELDANWDEDPRFKTEKYNLPIMISTPEFSGDSDDMRYDFVKDDWKKLCDLMASESFPDNGYRDLIDLDNIVDFMIANDIVQNNELVHPKSVFSYKDKGGKVSMGPLWDFDWAFSYLGYGHLYFTSSYTDVVRHSFFNRLFQDPRFLVRYKERWNEKYAEIAAISEYIDSLGAAIGPAVRMDAEMWYFDGGYMADYDTNHVRQAARMKTWWVNRTAWLNTLHNTVELLHADGDFGTESDYYTEVSPRTFTLVAYGDMINLSASIRGGVASDFEISAELRKAPSGNGGYLAAISVKPKDWRVMGTYTDTLVLSASNQGNVFTYRVPLTFAVKPERDFVVPQAIHTTYSPALTLGSLTLPAGYKWGAGVETGVRLNSGDRQSFRVTYFDVGGYWKDTSGMIMVNIAKAANPDYTLPEGLTAGYGRTLADVELTGGWSWMDGTVPVGGIGARTHLASFTHADTNYNVLTDIEVTIAVVRGAPDVAWPPGLTAMVGQTLGTVDLELFTNGSGPAGVFSWMAPGITFNRTGEWLCGMIFMPDDRVNYNMLTQDVIVKVEPFSIAVMGRDKEIPSAGPDEDVSAIAPPGAIAGKFTAGPNPAVRKNGTVNFYRQGARIKSGTLIIYDASGNVVNKVSVSDDAVLALGAAPAHSISADPAPVHSGGASGRIVGSWNLTDRSGRPVSEGAYLVRGTVTAVDGKKERVSLMLGVR